jgi:hypothetical protein
MSENHSDAVRLTGGCQCGAVRYQLGATPTGPSICHCRMCQKAGGAPFMAFAGVRRAQLRWTRGAPRIFQSSNKAERGFCGDCGTPLTFSMKERDRISVTIASLDDPARVPPRDQLGIEARLPWFATMHKLPELRTSDWMTAEKFGAVVSHQAPDHD